MKSRLDKHHTVRNTCTFQQIHVILIFSFLDKERILNAF